MNNLEIGGFIEFPSFKGRLYHDNALALNSARNCLAYLIETKKIRKIALPKFLCASVEYVCKQANVQISYYSVGSNFMPRELKTSEDEWLYLVNYYGQIGNREIERIKKNKDLLIVDNVQAYFQMPVKGVDTIYTCRKFFGVPDGAFLYTDSLIPRPLDRDQSANRMIHLLGRFEDTASKYYAVYIENEDAFETLPLRKMSKVTENLLRAIDYVYVRKRREDNYRYLQDFFCDFNKLELKMPEGSFMYPLYISNGYEIRKELRKKKIYIPILWPDVLNCCDESELEYDMAKNILPLPCDQRYDLNTMNYIAEEVKRYL